MDCRLSAFVWPLSEPEEPVKLGYTRIYFMSSTQPSQRDQRLYDDIPTPLAESVFPRIIKSPYSVLGSRWTGSSGEAVLLRDLTPMRLLHLWEADKIVQQQRHQPERRRPGEARGTEGGDKGSKDSGDLSELRGDSQHPSKSQPVLFVSADVTPNESVASTVTLGETGEVTFRNLRNAFHALPSRG
jgi:hypothetical protein